MKMKSSSRSNEENTIPGDVFHLDLGAGGQTVFLSIPDMSTHTHISGSTQTLNFISQILALFSPANGKKSKVCF